MAGRMESNQNQTIGAIIYAFDHEIAYTKLAVDCAKRVQKHLDIPCSLITDKPFKHEVFEHVILVDTPKYKNRRWWYDTDKTTLWLNGSRSNAYDLSPYDRTLLLDADYLVCENKICNLLNSSQPFFAHKRAMNVKDKQPRCVTFGTKHTEMWWATLVVFDRSEFSQDVFSAWQMIETNYNYYAGMFGFERKQYRNDYAISLALLLANGNFMPTQCDIPWPLFNADTDCAVYFNSEQSCEVNYGIVDEPATLEHKKLEICDFDIHVMGKSYLDNNYAVQS